MLYLKRIIIILLLFGSMALGANKYVITAGGDWSNAATWDDASSGGGGGDGKPGIGDTAILDLGSGNCELNENSAALGGLTMTGYAGTFDFNGNTIDVDGVAILVAGTFADTGSGGAIEVAGNLTVSSILPDGLTVTLNGSGTVSANVSGNQAGLVINAGAGTHTATDTGYWYVFSGSSGTYDGNDQAHFIDYSLGLGTAGLDTSTMGVWTLTGATLGYTYYNCHTGNNPPSTVVISSGNELRVNNDYTRMAKLTVPADATIAAHATGVMWFFPATDAFWDVDPAVVSGISLRAIATSDITTGQAIQTNDKYILLGGTHSITFDNEIDLGTGDLLIGYSSQGATVDFNGKAIAAGNIYDSGTGTNTLDVNTSEITISSTFDGDSIIITGSAVGGLPATVEGGTITNVDATTAHIDARGIGGSQPVDGGGNDNVRFDRGIIGGGIW